MNRTIRVVLCCCVVWALAATDVAADPVRVTNGFLTSAQTSPGSALAVTGTRGFSAVADVIPGEGNVEVFTNCGPCEPGVTIGVGAILGGSAFGGTVTLDGQSYQLTQSVVLNLEISATATTPLSQTPVGFVETPFSMKGMFFPGAGIGSVPLAGHGLASVFFRPLSSPDIRSGLSAADAAFAWNASFVHYEFQDTAATPEPATLTLLGIGALLAGGRKLRALRPRSSRG
jgi:hypothetical protein